MNLVWTVIAGALAGFLAGQVMKGRGFGVLGNIVLGIVGGAVGAFVFGILGITGGGNVAGQVLTSFLGAVLLLWVVAQIRNA